MKYKALKNITNGGDLIAADQEDLTAEDLGGQESAERLERLGAIQSMSEAKKAAKEAEAEAPAAESAKGGKK